MSKVATAFRTILLVVIFAIVNGPVSAESRVSPVMAQLYKIDLALQVHFLENGVLPLRLAELEERVSPDRAPKRIGVIDPWGKPVEYSRNDNGSCYSLRVVRGEDTWSMEGCVENPPQTN